MINGIRNSKSEKFIFKHNDIKHLETLLKKVDIDRPKIIVLAIFIIIHSMRLYIESKSRLFGENDKQHNEDNYQKSRNNKTNLPKRLFGWSYLK